MALQAIPGGFSVSATDENLLYEQRGLTQTVNENFIQVGAVFLKPSQKAPFDPDWFSKNFRDTSLQKWIDDPDLRQLNVGFNLQLGWVDVDIDSSVPDYNRCIVSAMDHLRIDTRFQFGRRSTGAPSHVLVQLGEDESANFNQLKQFEPNDFKYKGFRHKVELRSLATSIGKANVAREAKQTVMPGSIYVQKDNASAYDVSVWYRNGMEIAHKISELANTTPRQTQFNALIRAIAFGTSLYLLKTQWVEGNRQFTAAKVSGWLGRVVQDSNAINNHDAMADDVFCPIDSDDYAESLLEFVCKQMEDDEARMRIRTYHDARQKLLRNPDAKIPGWPTMAQLFGEEATNALRTVLMPGADVSKLTQFSERYLFDESDAFYIDRERFSGTGQYVHKVNDLEQRHKGDAINIGGKLKPAFKLFEVSSLRKRVSGRDLYPEHIPGTLFRVNKLGEPISDDDENEPVVRMMFNTWKGFPYQPAQPVNPILLAKCASMLDRLLGYLTQDNKEQAEWLKQWLAWTFQHPAQKQQVAPVIVGGQGVGKSFFGETFLQALLQNLWGSASPKLLEGSFAIEPFIDKLIVFTDEAKFHSEAATDAMKNLIRNKRVSGSEKYKSAKSYNIHARVIFASNRYDMNIGQKNVQDRALYYIKAYDKDYLKMTEAEFRAWTVEQKPFFDEFGALLERTDTREHYMHFFMELPTDRHAIENVEHSSVADSAVISANMTWPRLLAKYIIESGRIMEDVAIEMPFTRMQFNERVNLAGMETGYTKVAADKVWREFLDAGITEAVEEGGRRMFRFRWKIGTLTEVFGTAISATMEPHFMFDEGDYGPNDTTWATPKPWKGTNRAVFRKV